MSRPERRPCGSATGGGEGHRESARDENADLDPRGAEGRSKQARKRGIPDKPARKLVSVSFREPCPVNAAFFVDPESLQVLVVGDIPPGSASVLRNRARASAPARVPAGRPRH